MATSEWIESADLAGRRKAPKGDGFIERKAHHILSGALAGDDDARARAARHLLRFAPDPAGAAAALGLALPVGDDPAGPLVQLAARGDTCGARAWLDSRTLTEVSALGGRDR